MFGPFASVERKMRENAGNWLELADKVVHFRRDQLAAAQLAGLEQKRADLRLKLKERADAAKLKLGIEALEAVLRQTGGTFYPKSALVENVEFFLVAAIIILGIRTYFIQPFKIPTNSMWPSYYGMTAERLPLADDRAPGLASRIFRLVAFGASRREVVAPADGEVSAKFFPYGQVPQLAYTVKRGRKWHLLPAMVKEYSFFVGGVEATVQVPLDFREVDAMVQEAFFGGAEGMLRHFNAASRNGGVERSTIQVNEGSADATRTFTIKLGRTARAGETILRFDILTGDQLFVDRLSYHFVRPSVGQGFVFRTDNIHSEYMRSTDGRQIEQYYIKRLVGTPGDVLEIKEPVLYRNGRPIAGAAAFERNARREGLCRGYFNAAVAGGYLGRGDELTVPAQAYFAMGDNSGNSQDGRYWGFVPEKDVIGRPLFIYFPFTKRWGPAR